MTMDGEVAQAYAGALEAIARVDGEVNPEESAHLRALVGKRTTAAIDYESLFFEKTTPDKLAAKVPKADARAIGRLLVADAVELAIADGDLNGAEAQAIIRYARALGCTAEDVAAATNQLGEWVHGLG
ncbi:MAG: TerB family tellurite resistance protein [Kofleriaceae bacterium]